MSNAFELKTTNIVIAALGGEGGGVLTNWLIEVAQANGWLAQATSLAGVAQRTGATIYYIELFKPSESESRLPVMSLFPSSGDIDIALSSEITEAVRMLQRGFITAERTTLISSTHRVYGITEKIDLADGRIDSGMLLEAAAKYAKKFLCYDMQELALRHNSVISSVLFGALAGSEVLPFTRQNFVDVICQSGIAVDANLAAFEASYQVANQNKWQAERQEQTEGQHKQQDSVQQFDPSEASSKIVNSEDLFELPPAQSEQGRQLLDRLQNSFPKNTHFTIYHGLSKTIEYQDYDYAEQYLSELSSIVKLDGADYSLTEHVARYLALWMCFEDISRVARLKIRAMRMDEIRTEVKADVGQIFYVTEYFRPRPEEVCAVLPNAIGKRILASKFWKSTLNYCLGEGRKLRTNTVFIQLVLRCLASLGRFRRVSLGYRNEHDMINEWLSVIKEVALKDLPLATEVANCAGLVKGYGNTRSRTTAQLATIVAQVKQQRVSQAEAVIQLHEAALADDANAEFEKVLNNI